MSFNKKPKNENDRYIAKVKVKEFTNSQTGAKFEKLTVWVDNPFPENKDGSPNNYYKGALIWLDAQTGKYYQVVQLDLTNTSSADQERGFTNSLKIDLGSQYHVKEMA